MIKKFLPFEELVYHTTFTKKELLAHLQNEIEAENSFDFGINKSYSKPYIGKIYDNQFEIKRAISYRNSFLPIIKGEIKEDVSGSKIKVSMNLHHYVKIFMIVWLGAVTLASLATAYFLLFDKGPKTEADPFTFIPFIMLLGGIAMVIFGFKTESKKSIKDLEDILHAKIIQNNRSH